jgi:plastocyanin
LLQSSRVIELDSQKAWRFSKAIVVVILMAMTAMLASAAEAPPKGTVAGAAITGKVTVPAGQRLPDMVVYLESTDPNFKVDKPKAVVKISQQGAKFAPGLLVVPVGTQVDFNNDETKPVQHNVFSSSDAKQFDLGLYKPGEPIEPVEFDKPGVVRLRCSIHRYMDGVIYVTPTPYFAEVGKDGDFKIANVKPGKYRLKTWQRSQRYKEQQIDATVAGDKPTTLNVEMKR